MEGKSLVEYIELGLVLFHVSFFSFAMIAALLGPFMYMISEEKAKRRKELAEQAKNANSRH